MAENTHVTAVIGRWGNNLGVRFPGEITEAIGLSDGDRVDIDAVGDEIIIRRALPRVTLREMFAGRSPEEWRREYADAYDRGLDIGRENVK